MDNVPKFKKSVIEPGDFEQLKNLAQNSKASGFQYVAIDNDWLVALAEYFKNVE